MNTEPNHYDKTNRIGTPEDYRALAALADEYRVPFETLAERFEEHGQSAEEIRASLNVSGLWLLTPRAEEICSGLAEAVRKTGARLRRKPRNGREARSVGWLWYCEDVERVAAIKKERGVSLREALRIFGNEKLEERR